MGGNLANAVARRIFWHIPPGKRNRIALSEYLNRREKAATLMMPHTHSRKIRLMTRTKSPNPGLNQMEEVWAPATRLSQLFSFCNCAGLTGLGGRVGEIVGSRGWVSRDYETIPTSASDGLIKVLCLDLPKSST